MGVQELMVRLNDSGYKNWLKAGHCLRILKDGLHAFTDHEIKAFHGDLLSKNHLLRLPCQSSCQPKWKKPSSVCKSCSEWQKVILRHHRQPDATVYWDNCSASSWRFDHWELAKAYMPRGQTRVKGADQCDVSALLNLINFCDHFNSIDPRLVREVIHCRNDLMHSCDFRVDDRWMSRYRASLNQLLQQLCHVAEVSATTQQIHEMLTLDWSVLIPGVDRVDGLESDSVSQWEVGADSLSQWEVELLQERLQELLHSSETQDTEQLLRLKDFLLANKDLCTLFSSELHSISSLETKSRSRVKEGEEEDEEEEGGTV